MEKKNKHKPKTPNWSISLWVFFNQVPAKFYLYRKKLRSEQQLEYIQIFELQNNTTKGFIYLFIYIIIIYFNI
jgi:hypothetical protein